MEIRIQSSTMLKTMSIALPSPSPAPAIRTPATPPYADIYPTTYNSRSYAPTTPHNQKYDHAEAGLYAPDPEEGRFTIADLASARGRRSRVNAIAPGVVAPTLEPEESSSHPDGPSLASADARTSVDDCAESSCSDHFASSPAVEPSPRSGTTRSSQLLRSVSAGRRLTKERKGSIHRSRTTGGKSWKSDIMRDISTSNAYRQGLEPASSNRFLGWGAVKTFSSQRVESLGKADDSETSFIDLQGGAGQKRGPGETKRASRKTSSMPPSAFSYGVSSQVMRGSNEFIPGSPRKLKKRPKSASESNTEATVSTSSHRLSASTFISTGTAGTGASSSPPSPASRSSSTSRGYSLSRRLLGHRRSNSATSEGGAMENRRHSGLSDNSRLGLRRSLTTFRRSVGRTLGPGLTLAVASKTVSKEGSEAENAPWPETSASMAVNLGSLSDTGAATPTRDSSTTPRPAKAAVITIQAPTPPSSISHPFFDPSLQHKTSASTFRIQERESVGEVDDDAFDLEREMEDEIQEMRSESGSSNNHRALERFNAALNSIVPSSSETLYARYRDDGEKPWGACVPQTRNALSSPPVPSCDWTRGSPSTNHVPSTSTMPDVSPESRLSRSSPSTPRHGSTLRLSAITMGSVRSAFAGVGARMSSATSRMSLTSAAGASMRSGQRAEETDDDGDFMDLRDPFASPPPTEGKVKPLKRSPNMLAPSSSSLGEQFSSRNGGDREEVPSEKEAARGGDRRKMSAWGRLPMPARSAATSKRSSYSSTSRNSRTTGKSTPGTRTPNKSKERRSRKTSASSRAAGVAASRVDTEDVDFGLEEALLSQRLLSRLDANAWVS